MLGEDVVGIAVGTKVGETVGVLDVGLVVGYRDILGDAEDGAKVGTLHFPIVHKLSSDISHMGIIL